MVKAKKVYTPGSTPKRVGGRPKKRTAALRPKKYRLLYQLKDLDMAVKEVKEKRMTLGQAAKEFQVPYRVCNTDTIGIFPAVT
jgi:hypothetical protein